MSNELGVMSFAVPSDGTNPALHANQPVHKELKAKIQKVVNRVDLAASMHKVPYFFGGITNIPKTVEEGDKSDDEPQGQLRLVTVAGCHVSVIVRVEEQLGIKLPVMAAIFESAMEKACTLWQST